METAYQTNISSQPASHEESGPREQKIIPFLWFDDNAGEAMNFYTSVFPNSAIMNSRPGPDGKIITGTFQLNGLELMALNAGPMFKFSPAISFFVTCETDQEADRLWNELSPGGKVLMDLGKYPFSEKYGWVEDKFGISWQLMQSDSVQKISPSLLFVGDQYGNAEEAVNFYTSLFQNSGVAHIERYTEEDQDTAGKVKYCSFILNGQEFGAMESGMDHQFTFTPAISFFVKCETQEEIDEFWEKFSKEGQKQKCGWVQDKYGVSWQIIPPVLGKMLSDPDQEKAQRVMNAMLQMDKIIIKDLEQAYNDGNQTPAETQDLTITREFHLPLETVWRAWTEPESFKKWCGPKDYTCPQAFIDLKPGGKYLNCMRSPQGADFWSTGVYKEIVPLQKLVMSDSFSDEDGNVIPASDLNIPGNWPLVLQVTVIFQEKNGTTVMNLTHAGLPPEMLEDCKKGWQESFDKLEKNLKEDHSADLNL